MISLYFKLASRYKYGFLSLLLCCTMTLFLLSMVLSIKDFYENYSTIRMGFIPTVSVTIETPYDAHQMDTIVNTIKNNFPIDHSLQGAACLLERANFHVEKNVALHKQMFATIHKKKQLIGIDFKGNHNLEIKQGGTIISSKVIQMDEFGRWYLDIEKNNKLHEGEAYLIDSKNHFLVKLSDRGTYFRIHFIEKEAQAVIAFFDFLNRFIHQFQKPTYAGIGTDRFVYTLKKDSENIKYFHIYLKRYIVAYAGLIFQSQTDVMPVIVSSDLLHSINEYDYITLARLQSKNYNIPMIAYDAFNISPEQHMSKSMLLTNLTHFNKHIKKAQSHSFLYLYCNHKWANKIVQMIHQMNNQAACLTRQNIVPSYLREQNIVFISILTLFSLFVGVYTCIVLIKLMKFYSIFQDDLTLLKLYGNQFAIFTISVLCMTIIANGISVLLFNQFIHWNNQLLDACYYPSIFMNWTNFVYASLISWGIVIISLFLENRMLNQLNYAHRGNNQ